MMLKSNSYSSASRLPGPGLDIQNQQQIREEELKTRLTDGLRLFSINPDNENNNEDDGEMTIEMMPPSGRDNKNDPRVMHGVVEKRSG